MATRDKEGHCIIIKRSIHPDYITIINIYTPNVRVHNYIKQILTDLKRDIDSSTVIGDFNTPLSITVDYPERKSIGKEWT